MLCARVSDRDTVEPTKLTHPVSEDLQSSFGTESAFANANRSILSDPATARWLRDRRRPANPRRRFGNVPCDSPGREVPWTGAGQDTRHRPVKSTSAGEANGQRVTWFCANGGTIDIVAEALVVPFSGTHGWIAFAVMVSLFVLVKRVRRPSASFGTARRSSGCTTCSAPLPRCASFCPSCGDLTRGD
jgi:hypothetical protein